MRITMIGATSRVGAHLLPAAHRLGHEIIAVTRQVANPPLNTPPVTVVTGDARDRETVRKAIHNVDAVVVIVNGGNRRDPHVAADVIDTVVSEMHEQGVKRLLATSAYPVVGERPRLPMWILRRIFATAYADVRQMEHHITASNLDWTIVRLNRLNDKRRTGRTIVSRDQLAEPRPMSRADAADVVLDALLDPALRQEAVNASGTR